MPRLHITLLGSFQVRLHGESIASFRTSMHMADLEQAAKLYRGNLLPGFGLPGCEAFDDWLLLTREHFTRLAVTVLEALAHRRMSAGL